MCREGAWTELTVSVTAGLSIPGGCLVFLWSFYDSCKSFYQIYHFQFYGMDL